MLAPDRQICQHPSQKPDLSGAELAYPTRIDPLTSHSLMPKPPPIDQKLVEHLGELARISLPKERQTELRDKLQQIVDAFSALGEVNFEAGEDDATARTVTPADLRPDRAETPPDVTEVLANAPQVAADCFVVARVVEP